jgi:soluble lytic murein transglycosylase-like protein
LAVNLHRFAWLVLLFFQATSLAAADRVYKFVDDDGIVHYTNVRPEGLRDFSTLDFPCYASDPACRQVDWEHVPLDTRTYAAEIGRAAADNDVDASLIRAIIHAESAYRPDAVSPRGARGLMQLMPATEAELGVADVFNPASNIFGGANYLAQMLDEFEGDVDLATAAYNAGPGAVHKYGGVPPYPQTREYVRRIQILYRRYRLAGG